MSTSRQFNPSPERWSQAEQAYFDCGTGYFKIATVAKGKGRPLKDGFRLVWIWDEDDNDFPAEWKQILIDRLEAEDLELEDIRLYFKEPSPTILKDVMDRGIGKPRQEDYAASYPIICVHNTIPGQEVPVDDDLVIAYAQTKGGGLLTDYDLNPPELEWTDEE